jgi:hypothetical protein
VTERRLFRYAILRAVPGWLRGTVGGGLLQAIGMQLDDLVDRAADSVELRFPDADRPEALGPLGRDRRIKRGPLEEADTYAGRLRGWWQAHRNRGGPYALLEQQYAHLRSFYDDGIFLQTDLVYHSGTRRILHPDGTITRDSIEWGADGTGLWSQAWLFHHAAAEPTVTPDTEEILKHIPREWSPAHLLPMHVVLLWDEDGVRLWGYPPAPPPTWGDMTLSGLTWAETSPVILLAA